MSNLPNIIDQFASRSAGKRPFGKVIVFDMKGQTVRIDATGDTIAVSEGGEPSDVTIHISEADLLGVLDGSLNAQSLVMTGRIRMKGNAMVAMQLGELLR